MRERDDSSDVSTGSDWIIAAVDRYEAPLTLYVTRMLGNLDRARDIVQDAFLRLCRQRPESVTPHLAEWLYTVCRNRALDVARKETRMTPIDPACEHARADASVPPNVAVEQKETAGRILQMLEQLPPNQREVIRLKFQGGLSYKEISGITGLSVTNVGFLIHTGLKTLRQKMGQP